MAYDFAETQRKSAPPVARPPSARLEYGFKARKKTPLTTPPRMDIMSTSSMKTLSSLTIRAWDSSQKPAEARENPFLRRISRDDCKSDAHGARHALFELGEKRPYPLEARKKRGVFEGKRCLLDRCAGGGIKCEVKLRSKGSLQRRIAERGKILLEPVGH